MIISPIFFSCSIYIFLGRSPWLQEHRHTSMLSSMSMYGVMNCDQKAGGDTSSCPGTYLTIACPGFHVGCSYDENFTPCQYAAADVHGIMSCNQKSLIILAVHTPTSPVRVPNQRVAFLEFRVGMDENFFLWPHIYIVHEYLHFFSDQAREFSSWS